MRIFGRIGAHFTRKPSQESGNDNTQMFVLKQKPDQKEKEQSSINRATSIELDNVSDESNEHLPQMAQFAHTPTLKSTGHQQSITALTKQRRVSWSLPEVAS